jgi:hypothetical protein
MSPVKVYVDGFCIDTLHDVLDSEGDSEDYAFTPKVQAALEGLQVADVTVLPSKFRPRFVMITTRLKK